MINAENKQVAIDDFNYGPQQIRKAVEVAAWAPPEATEVHRGDSGMVGYCQMYKFMRHR